jgi:hypothetical protein
MSADKQGTVSTDAQLNVCPYCKSEVRGPFPGFLRHKLKCLKKKEKFMARFVKCPECPKHFLKDQLKKHVSISHGQAHAQSVGALPPKIRVVPVNPVVKAYPLDLKPDHVKKNGSKLIQCLRCKALWPASLMEGHSKSCSSVMSDIESLKRSASKLPFMLLPPCSLGEAIGKYRALLRSPSHDFWEELDDPKRLMRIDSLGTVARRYIGVRGWKGYWVFQFKNSNKVVLECPRTGNATYILHGEWRKMVDHTKAELRSEFRHLSERIIHESNWENHVRRAVFGRQGR